MGYRLGFYSGIIYFVYRPEIWRDAKKGMELLKLSERVKRSRRYSILSCANLRGDDLLALVWLYLRGEDFVEIPEDRTSIRVTRGTYILLKLVSLYTGIELPRLALEASALHRLFRRGRNRKKLIRWMPPEYLEVGKKIKASPTEVLFGAACLGSLL